MVLPFFLPLPGKAVPFPVQRLLVEPLLQRQLQTSWQDGELDFLRGRFVAVEIPDLGVRWWLTLGMRGITMVYGRLQADATLRGELSVFIALAQQQQDPDTLFFRRQLSITGDTELALHLKNLLYRIQWLPEIAAVATRLQPISDWLAPSPAGRASNRSPHRPLSS